jgi:sugar/nucleoside kinase (ribokinase family)
VAEALLSRPGCKAEWIVIKCGADGAVLFPRGGDSVSFGSPVVEVGDTVGCGDSAAAAVVLGYLEIMTQRKQRTAAGRGDVPPDELREMQGGY